MAPLTTPKRSLLDLPADGPINQDVLQRLDKELRGGIAEEKVQAMLRQARLARIMREAGSVSIPGIGQLKAKIDARLYFRWVQEYGPKIWSDDDFFRTMARDNPQILAPGYKL